MNPPTLFLALMLTAGPFGLPHAHAATVLTEDFESPVLDVGFIIFNAGDSLITATNTWEVSVSGIDLFLGSVLLEVVVFDGLQAVDLTGTPGAGVITTGFVTTPGQTYRLTFHYARNNGLGSQIGSAQVEVLGLGTLLQAAVTHDPATEPFDRYLEFSGNFTADANLTSLRFTSLNDGFAGITVDGISIETTTAVDTDGDGIDDNSDNCLFVSNSDQRDTDADNIGNLCDPDVAQPNDCTVNFPDLNVYKTNFFAAGDLDTDNNGDGQTNFLDLNIVKGFFFGPPGPSAAGCD